MGLIIGLGILWVVSEIVHKDKDAEDKIQFSVAHALGKIDTPSVLFFLGILLGVSALQSAGILAGIATWLTSSVGNIALIVLIIGLLSALVDNVPLVAAAMGMYTMDQYPQDDFLWTFLAFSAGTGGSALIIGSAAGVAAMGIEKISFGWYLKKISWLALLGYFAGAGVFLLLN
jgi:Na+/H+ antiporter NhaD/arsenite permease-like protein